MMKLTELLRDIDVLELRAPADMEITDVCYDSRPAQPRDGVVAARG